MYFCYDLILNIVDKWVNLLDIDVFDVGAVLSESCEWELPFPQKGQLELEASKRVADMLARDHSIEHLIGG